MEWNNLFMKKHRKEEKKSNAFANHPTYRLIEMGLVNGADWKKCVATVSEMRGEVCDILETGLIPQLQTVLRMLEQAIPCKEFQLMLQDTESIMLHLQDLKENGPSAPFTEKPVEETQMDAEVIPLKQDDEPASTN